MRYIRGCYGVTSAGVVTIPAGVVTIRRAAYPPIPREGMLPAMAGPNQSDQIAELSMCMLDLYQAAGLVRNRIGWAGDGLGKLARFSRAAEKQVQAQLNGEMTAAAWPGSGPGAGCAAARGAALGRGERGGQVSAPPRVVHPGPHPG